MRNVRIDIQVMSIPGWAAGLGNVWMWSERQKLNSCEKHKCLIKNLLVIKPVTIVKDIGADVKCGLYRQKRII